MKTKMPEDIKKSEQLSDEELKNINGGMKAVVEDDSSWYRAIVDLFFKVKP